MDKLTHDVLLDIVEKSRNASTVDDGVQDVLTYMQQLFTEWNYTDAMRLIQSMFMGGFGVG